MKEKNDNVVLAETAGFCWGVKRAIDITLDISANEDGPIYTHGPLIHNPQVINMLEGKDVYAVGDTNELKEGSTVIIRTHGVTPDVRKGIKDTGLVISDATCPLVARVQGIIKKYAHKGYTTIIVGDNGHAEVVGLTGYTEGRFHVIDSVGEIANLPPMEKVNIVAQTTCDTNGYAQIVEALRQRYKGAVVNDTICDATQQRQGEARELAGRVDAMIVVGGNNSANTARLAKIAEETGTLTFLIETEEELDLHALSDCKTIGVTAGASTPTWMIKRVVERLETVRDKRREGYLASLISLARIAVTSNLSLAVGAGFMTVANATIAGFTVSAVSAYIAGAYVFSMYVINNLNDVTTFKRNEPQKIRFYLKHQSGMTLASVVAGVSAMVLAFAQGTVPGLVFITSMALGLGYTIKWFPKTRYLRIHRLKDIPASKDFFVGFAWAVVTAILPAISAGAEVTSPSLAVAVFFTFTLVYIRAVLCDIRDIQGDQLIGRETIPILIGKPATKIFLGLLCAAGAMALGLAYLMGWAGPFALLCLLSILYTALYLLLYHWRIITGGARFDLMVDGVFHLTGLMALIWIIAG